MTEENGNNAHNSAGTDAWAKNWQVPVILLMLHVDAYMNMFRAPLASYKQTVETAQALTKHVMEVAQHSAQ